MYVYAHKYIERILQRLNIFIMTTEYFFLVHPSTGKFLLINILAQISSKAMISETKCKIIQQGIVHKFQILFVCYGDGY